MLTWKPSDKTWLPAPTDLRATRVEKSVELSWKPTTDAVGWQIERRTLDRTGWSAWKKAAEVNSPLNNWRDPAPAGIACAYRLRALGVNKVTSDWSKTCYAR